MKLSQLRFSQWSKNQAMATFQGPPQWCERCLDSPKKWMLWLYLQIINHSEIGVMWTPTERDFDFTGGPHCRSISYLKHLRFLVIQNAWYDTNDWFSPAHGFSSLNPNKTAWPVKTWCSPLRGSSSLFFFWFKAYLAARNAGNHTT